MAAARQTLRHAHEELARPPIQRVMAPQMVVNPHLILTTDSVTGTTRTQIEHGMCGA
ncbi:hypothetical protein [Chloroflexus aurantiacus]|uniref:hypothetical protein n=1 Tax=Chloroflexus aurantiacus TaxID=1108 RepID=UPI000173C582|nr:hypothetical protein [Chloroflexus aurantiacus]